MLNGKKILITSCAGLGDLLIFTPALRAIKEKYPQCKITFVTSWQNKDILSGLPYIDKVVTIQRKKAFGRLRVAKYILQQDYVIFTDWQPQLAVCAYLFRVPNRIAIPKPGHSLNRLFTKTLENHVMASPRYAAETDAIIFSEALGVNLEGNMTKLDVSPPSNEDVQRVDALLSKLVPDDTPRYICFAPFTGLEERNWPVEHAVQFIEMVKRHLNIPLVLIGPPSKMEVSKCMDAINLVGKTSTLEMVEIIRRAALFVGPDSGPMHIAGAVGTPLIALFNKDLPSRWAPRNNCRVITLNLSCSPCDDDRAKQCSTLACMRGITPKMVFDATKEALRELAD